MKSRKAGRRENASGLLVRNGGILKLFVLLFAVLVLILILLVLVLILLILELVLLFVLVLLLVFGHGCFPPVILKCDHRSADGCSADGFIFCFAGRFMQESRQRPPKRSCRRLGKVL